MFVELVCIKKSVIENREYMYIKQKHQEKNCILHNP